MRVCLVLTEYVFSFALLFTQHYPHQIIHFVWTVIFPRVQYVLMRDWRLSQQKATTFVFTIACISQTHLYSALHWSYIKQHFLHPVKFYWFVNVNPPIKTNKFHKKISRILPTIYNTNTNCSFLHQQIDHISHRTYCLCFTLSSTLLMWSLLYAIFEYSFHYY